MNNYDEAQGEYNKALSTNIPALKSRVLYNLGNNAYRKGDNDQALEYYKKALEVDPNDEDAKYNYEFLKNAKLNPQKNKNDKGKGKDNKDKDKDKSKQGDNKNDKDKNGQSKEDKQKMSKEDAQRILQYFDESDKNNAKKRKMSMPKMPKNEEDW